MHQRRAQTKLSVFPRANMVLQHLDPICVKARGSLCTPCIKDNVLHHSFDGRLTLVMCLFPLLIRGTEFVPIRTLRLGPMFFVSSITVGKRDDPVLKQIALRIGAAHRASYLHNVSPAYPWVQSNYTFDCLSLGSPPIRRRLTPLFELLPLSFPPRLVLF